MIHSFYTHIIPQKYVKSQDIDLGCNFGQQTNYEFSEEPIKDAFKREDRITEKFPTQEREAINATYWRIQNEVWVYNFICFNYTKTLDNCLEIVKNSLSILGKHTSGRQTLNHGLGKMVHVHGTVDENMIFGVDDEIAYFKSDPNDLCRLQLYYKWCKKNI